MAQPQLLEGNGDTGDAQLLIVQAKSLGERTLLDTLCALGDSPQQATTTMNALMGMVARSIRALELENGSGLVIPTAQIIHRSQKASEKISRTAAAERWTEEDRRVSDERDELDSMLLRRADALARASSPEKRIEEGVTLGDFATHVASGWGLNRNFGHGQGGKRYAAASAITGYQTALIASTGLHTPAARAARSYLPIVMERMRDVILALSHVLRRSEIQEGL